MSDPNYIKWCEELQAENAKQKELLHAKTQTIAGLDVEVATLREAIQACVDDDFNSYALTIELTAALEEDTK